jgi:hypothetical protein
LTRYDDSKSVRKGIMQMLEVLLENVTTEVDDTSVEEKQKKTKKKKMDFVKVSVQTCLKTLRTQSTRKPARFVRRTYFNGGTKIRGRTDG